MLSGTEERIILSDIQKTKDNPVDRAKVLANAIKVNKEKLDYYLKTGKLEKAEDKSEITVNYGNDTLKELSIIQKYINTKEIKQKDTEK